MYIIKSGVLSRAKLLTQYMLGNVPFRVILEQMPLPSPRLEIISHRYPGAPEEYSIQGNAFVNEGRKTLLDRVFDLAGSRTNVRNMKFTDTAKGSAYVEGDSNLVTTIYTTGGFAPVQLTMAAQAGAAGIDLLTDPLKVTFKTTVTNDYVAGIKNIAGIGMFTDDDEPWALANVSPLRAMDEDGDFTPIWTYQW